GTQQEFIGTVLLNPMNKDSFLFNCQASDSCHGCTGFKNNFEILFFFYAAPKINNQLSISSKRFQYFPVLDCSCFSAVQIYQVQSAQSSIFKHPGYFEWIFIINCF